MATLVFVGSADSIEEDIASAGMAAIQLAFNEAMSKLDLITQSWQRSADEALALEPSTSTDSAAVAESTPQAA